MSKIQKVKEKLEHQRRKQLELIAGARSAVSKLDEQLDALRLEAINKALENLEVSIDELPEFLEKIKANGMILALMSESEKNNNESEMEDLDFDETPY